MKTKNLLLIILMVISFSIQAQHNYDNQSTIYSISGKVGVGTTNPIYKFQAQGDIYANGGWFRAAGNNGIYFQTHGGGFRMVDTSWIRTYGGKSFYHDKGIMRTDGQLQAGPSGNRFIVKQEGNVGIGVTNPVYKLQAQGDIYANGSWLRVAGNNGIYFQTHGGGFVMTDKTWIRTYGGKSFYHDKGIMRTDGQLQAGPSGNRFIVKQEGNVGIGVTNPVYKLQAQGDIYANGGWLRVAGNNGIYFQTHGGGLRMTDDTWIRTYGGKSFYHDKGIMRTDGQLQVGAAGNRFIVNSLGNVGIGSSKPGAWKLAVNGNIRAKEIKVETDWADFVFEDDYNLPTLKAVENHIKEKGHLKDIPSANEVEKNGILLGEMNSKLLQKIEELTLYTIKQEKRINTLELSKTNLEKDNKILKSMAQRLSIIEKYINKN